MTTGMKLVVGENLRRLESCLQDNAGFPQASLHWWQNCGCMHDGSVFKYLLVLCLGTKVRHADLKVTYFPVEGMDGTG